MHQFYRNIFITMIVLLPILAQSQIIKGNSKTDTTSQGNIMYIQAVNNTYRVTYNNPNQFLLDSIIENNFYNSKDSLTSYTLKNANFGTRNFVNLYYKDTNTLQTYSITTSVIYGQISPSAFVMENSSYTITYSAVSQAYILDSIYIDGVSIGTDSLKSYTFYNVNQNHTIKVIYKIKNFRISVQVIGNGTANFTDTTVNLGQKIIIKYSPQSGNQFDSLTINNQIDQGLNIDSLILNNIDTSYSVNIYFSLKPANTSSIRTGVSIGGVIASLVNVTNGSNYRITYKALNSNYILDSIFINNIYRGKDSMAGYTFYNINGDSIIYIKYRPATVSIKATATAGGSISPGGTFTFPYNTTFKYLILANTGFVLDSLFVNGIYVPDSTTSYTFKNITMNQTIFAKFKVRQLRVSISKIGGGSVTPFNDTLVNYNTNLILVFPNYASYFLDTLFINGAPTIFSASNNPLNYTLNNIIQNYNIICKFSPKPNLIPILTQVNNGFISARGNVDSGSSFRVTYQPINSYFTLDSIFVNGNYIGIDSNSGYTFSNIRATQSIYVTYKFKEFFIYDFISISVVGNGSVTPPGPLSLKRGSKLSLKFIPNANNLVDSVFVNNIYIPDSVTGYTVNSIARSYSITVKFKPSPSSFSITSTAGPNGNISPIGQTSVATGGNQSYQFIPNIGYEVDSVYVNNVYLYGVKNSYTFNNISSNQTIRVVFRIIIQPVSKNLTIQVTSNTCINQRNGVIKILAAKSYNYVYTVTNLQNNSTLVKNFNSNIDSITNLASGNYQILFQLSGRPDTLAIYQVTVNQPDSLNVYAVLDNINRQVTFSLSGSSVYFISLNGNSIKTNASHYTLNLNKGINDIKVTGEKDCQGAFNQKLTFSKDVIIYPNPTKGEVSVYLGGTEQEVTVEFFNEQSTKILNDHLSIPSNRILNFNLSNQKPGYYFIKINGKQVFGNYKILKH